MNMSPYGMDAAIDAERKLYCTTPDECNLAGIVVPEATGAELISQSKQEVANRGK